MARTSSSAPSRARDSDADRRSTDDAAAGRTQDRVLVATEGIEQVELTEPWAAVLEAGAHADLLSTEAGEVQPFNHLDKVERFPVDVVVADADPDDYDGLVLPGGEWVDREVVVDNGLVFGRKPDDLPAFCAKLVEELAEGRHATARAGAARS